MSKLWDRGGAVDHRIERFTVGRDRELDLELVAWDALASAAHATMLERIGVLDRDELADLRRELGIIAREARAGAFRIGGDEEDGHSAIEHRLTERLGDAGRRIHTGRSRNDQVIAALRLWGRDALLGLLEALADAAELLLELAGRHREVALPGYSHTRQAMPSTAGFLFAAHAEGLLDDVPWLEAAWRHLDRSPLGAASGFGVALPLDRRLVAELLGFSELQVNALAVQNDRGKAEMLTLAAAAGCSFDAARLASDLIWFSGDELGCFRLAEEVTTGSSIMPQKRNPDVLELIRAGASRVAARQAEAAAIYGTLPSGYHRDLQLTKEPFLDGLSHAAELLAALRPALEGLEVDGEACRRAMRRSIGATDEVYRRVARGEPFRSAYRAVAADPEGAVADDPAEGWRLRTHEGAPGALDPEARSGEVEALRRRVAERRAAGEAVWRRLLE